MTHILDCRFCWDIFYKKKDFTNSALFQPSLTEVAICKDAASLRFREGCWHCWQNGLKFCQKIQNHMEKGVNSEATIEKFEFIDCTIYPLYIASKTVA